jgi:ABC-type multidrug transport system permease subunit
LILLKQAELNFKLFELLVQLLFQNTALFPVFKLVANCLIYLKPNQVLNEIVRKLLLNSFDSLDMMITQVCLLNFALTFLLCGVKLPQPNLLSGQALLRSGV